MDDLILYTQPGCADSRHVRDWLTERGVRFSERSVVDADSARALAATGIFATPLLVRGDRHVFGFRPDALAILITPAI